MKNEEILHGVAELTRKTFAYQGEISLGTRTDEIDGWDSFGTMEMVLAVEQKFSLEIPITQIPQLDTIGKIVSFIAEAKA